MQHKAYDKGKAILIATNWERKKNGCGLQIIQAYKVLKNVNRSHCFCFCFPNATEIMLKVSVLTPFDKSYIAWNERFTMRTAIG